MWLVHRRLVRRRHAEEFEKKSWILVCRPDSRGVRSWLLGLIANKALPHRYREGQKVSGSGLMKGILLEKVAGCARKKFQEFVRVLKRNENLCVGESTVLMSPSMLLFLDFTVVALHDYIQNNPIYI